jgi:hypothetical protein
MTTNDWTKTGLAQDAAGFQRAQWGLASLLIGAVLVLAALNCLNLRGGLWQSSPRSAPGMPALIATVANRAVVLGLAVFGIMAGRKGGCRVAAGTPASPLATAGVVAGFAAIILWLIISIDLFPVMISFMV